MTPPSISNTISQNGNMAEEKQVKEYGRMVLFVIKHKTAFGLIGGGLLAGYTTIQTLKSELVQVKSDVTSISNKVDKFDDKLDKLIQRSYRPR